MLTAQALELRVKPGNSSEPEVLGFTWTMLDQTEDYIWIQIEWEYPERLSEHTDQEDQMEIYFWGNTYGYFYAQDASEEVRYGTRLEVPMVRQIDHKTAKAIGGASSTLRVTLFSAFAFVIMFSG